MDRDKLIELAEPPSKVPTLLFRYQQAELESLRLFAALRALAEGDGP
jgi:hypothetical protein